MLRHGASLNEIGELLRRQARANSLAPVGPVVARRGPMNTLCQAVDDYLELRRGLGFKLVKYGACLREFVSFLEQKKTSQITTALALQFAMLHPQQDGVSCPKTTTVRHSA